MEEELEQCVHEKNNLKRVLDMLQNDYGQMDELCHNMRTKILDYEQNEKGITAELENLKEEKGLLLVALKKSEDQLEIYVDTDRNYRDVLRQSKLLEKNLSDLEDENTGIMQDTEKLKKYLEHVCGKETTIRQDLEQALQNIRDLEDVVDSLENQAVEQKKENEGLNEIIREMREERAALSNNNLEELLSSPQNLFHELAACGVYSDDDFTFANCSSPDASSPVNFEELNASVACKLKTKEKVVKSLRKKLKIVTLTSQKYKIKLRQLRNLWKGKEEAGHVEDSLVTVVVKDGVQTGKPRVVIIETVSIATQTEKIPILAAAVQTHSHDDYSLSESSEDTSSEISRPEVVEAFLEHRADNYDIDVYRDAGNEAATHSDADSSDSGCKLISLEPEVNVDENRSNKETSLPHVLEALKSLTDDEVETRAQQLELALQTDSQTLVARLQLRQRHREIAEKNLGSEIERMRTAIRSLQYLCTDRNSLDILTTVQTQLDYVMASAMSVSSTSEAYGYVQSEECMTTAMAPLVRYVDTVANARLERPLESPRSPFLSLDEPRDDDRIMRRRSVAVVPLSLESRRRASIPFLPRPPSPLPRNGIASQPVTTCLELNRRDSTVRQRREIRVPETAQMAEILESSEQSSTSTSPCSCKLSTSPTLSPDLEKPADQLEFRTICRQVTNFVLLVAVLVAGFVVWSGLESEVREKPS